MGTYGDDLTREFFRRTVINLDDFEKLHEKNPKKYPNNITQLVNSLLGLIVFVKEDQQPLSGKIYEELTGDIILWNYGSENKNSQTLIRHLRNAIAHAKLKANGTDTSIESITFNDADNRNNRDYKFEIILTTTKIRKLIQLLKKEILGL